MRLIPKARKLPNPGKNPFHPFDDRYFAPTRSNASPFPKAKIPNANRRLSSVHVLRGCPTLPRFWERRVF
jgi:hypothetical protein